MRKTLLAVALAVGIATAYAMASPQAGRTDCIPYDPSTLKLVELSSGLWQLERGDGAKFRIFATRADAESGLAVYKEHSTLCYIGRGNKYGSQFVMEYLKK